MNGPESTRTAVNAAAVRAGKYGAAAFRETFGEIAFRAHFPELVEAPAARVSPPKRRAGLQTVCLECGRKSKSLDDECPRCGGSDLEVA